MKIHPVGAESFHEDGRMDKHTDMSKLITNRNCARSLKVTRHYQNFGFVASPLENYDAFIYHTVTQRHELDSTLNQDLCVNFRRYSAS